MHTRLLPVDEVVRCLAAARKYATSGVYDQSVSVDQALVRRDQLRAAGPSRGGRRRLCLPAERHVEDAAPLLARTVVGEDAQGSTAQLGPELLHLGADCNQAEVPPLGHRDTPAMRRLWQLLQRQLGERLGGGPEHLHIALDTHCLGVVRRHRLRSERRRGTPGWALGADEWGAGSRRDCIPYACALVVPGCVATPEERSK